MLRALKTPLVALSVFLQTYSGASDSVGILSLRYNKTALADGKRMWFEIAHPKLEKSVFFTGEPASMGLPEYVRKLHSWKETTLYITPTSSPIWEAKSTHWLIKNKNKRRI